ncbi:hypothetical protein, partial [Histophilus somni]
VSELANNRQVASRVEATESKPKCGVFLGMFKVLPLALVVSVALSSNTFAAWIGTYGGTVGSEKREMEYIYKGRDKYRLHGVALNPSGNNNGSNYSKVSIGGVAVGHDAWASGDNSTGVGADAHAIGMQSVVVGNNSGANNQSVAIGSDVFAYGKSAIAIGNDDIDDHRFNDRLPVTTINNLFSNLGSNLEFFKDGWSSFAKKYISDNGTDNRHYSPTYAKGVGSIAIGSRNIAGGEFATSLGALSFALADRSTAIGVRAFVDQNSTGGVAIGDESRVFAANSFAIGNKAESTNKGSLSYGSGAKAVGEGSIAIGSTVISNAKYKDGTDEKFRTKLMSELGIGMVTEKVDTSNHVKETSAKVSNLKVGNNNEIVQSGFSAHLDRDQINEKINKVIQGLTFAYEEEKDTLLSVGGTDIKKTKSDGKHGITVGYYTVNSGDNTVAIGTASYVKGRNSVVLGALNNVGQYASNTIAIGVGTNVHKENSIALGTGTTVTGAGVVAIGSGVGVTKDNTIAVGYGALGKSGESIVLGNSATLEEHASKSIVIGNGAKVENTKKDDTIKKLSWPEDEKYRNGEKELEMSAIAIGTSATANAQNSVAFGNEAQVSMENSVALGNKSHTKYFYQDDNNKNIATLIGNGKNDAINLDPYVPEGSSYNLKTDKAAGIVSVGWTKNGNGKTQELGLRRIVGVAPGALDSDVVTVGQLKALYYVKKEGVVTYYTKDGNNIIKLTKDADGKFYKVNTKDGTPYKDLGAVDAKNVFVGPKGANETTKEETIQRKKYSLGDMGNKIKFAHILDGNIETGSDQAITGNQLHQLGSTILGLKVKNSKTEFEKVQFEAVEVTDPKKKTGKTDTFKEALTEVIEAINRGYKFSADQVNNKANETPFYLGATIEIKAGDVTKPGNTIEKYLGKNLKTEFKNDSSKATFTIGLKEDPSFKKVTIEDTIEDKEANKKLAVNKEYVDNKLKNVSTNLHFLSVQGNDKAAVNYNNDGAKANYSVAIGVNAQVADPINSGVPKNKPKPTATAGIAIGYNAKSEAENAVAIGRDVSIDVPNSFVMGSNNIVTQSDKDVRSAVVVIGSGTKLVESKSSIAIGAVYVERGDKKDGTVIENAAWTASIGNKNKIKNGTDIVAVGNNIEVKDDTNEENPKNKTKIANNDLILIGNGATAETAKESVLIGAKSNAGKGAKSAVIIGHSAKAETNAVGAVAIGQGATVKTDAGNSIALGQGSEATAKEEAKKDATVSFDSTNIKFKWTGGVSSNSGDKKSVLSIGKKNNERIIKHVAAGAVTATSTDAINGSQLYAVADEFSKLAVNVLGAEKADGDTAGFKKSTFDVAKYQGSTNTPAQKEMTFKDAIGQNTTAINKGFIFGVGDQTNEYGTHYLGDKLIIKAGAIDKPTTITTSEDGYSPNNIKTHYEKNSKNILIGIKDKPTFKNVIIENGIPEDEEELKKGNYDKHAVNKKYLDKRLEKVAANFTVKGDNPKAGEGYTLDKDHNELIIAGDSKNIETTVDKDHKKVSINLKDTLTGITSIANNDTKIELNNGTGGNGTKSIVFTSGDNSKSVTLTGDKFSGVSEIGKDDQAKITFKNNGSNEIDFKAGSTTYKFTDSGLDLASKAITNLASGLDNVVNNGKKDLDELLKLVATNGQSSGSSNDGKLNKAVNVKDLLHVANELKNKGLTFQGNGDDTDKVTRKLGETLKIVGETSSTGSTQTTETAAGNITVAKKNGTTNEADTLEIKLSKNLKGIGSVANGDDVKIELKTTGTSGSNTKSIVFTAGDSSNSVTLTGDKFSGVSEISGKNSKSKLTLGADNATVELAHDKSKLELKDTEATITAGDNAGSIKITSNGSKKIELSPENGAKLTLEKDSTTNSGSNYVKATGLSHVGLDNDNALIFKNGNNNGNTAVLKVGNADLTFTPTGSNGNQKVQISGLSSGLTDIGSSTGTSGNNSTQKLDELLKLKPQSSGTSNNQDKLSRAVNVEDLLDIAQGLVDKGLKFQGNDTSSTITTKLGGTLKIVGETATSTSGTTATTQITTAPDNITVKKKSGSEDTLEIGLSDALKGITSISGKNGSNGSAVAKIEFTNGGTGGSASTSPTVKITAGGGTFTFGDNGLDLGNKKITKLESGLGLTNGVGTGGSTVNGNEEIIKKVLEGNPDGTNGSPKISNNAVNVKDLSEVAKAIVTKGLTFAGNTGEAKAALGDKITIKGDGTYLTSKASSNGSKEIEFSLTDSTKNKVDIINVGTTNNGDNSFALGKDSKWEGKKTAPSGIIPNAGKDEVKFSWTTAGASKTTNPVDMKEVISVGNTNAERIITHVAAGKVDTGSTDAINGGQLKSVIDVFANLGINVLGAEKAEADKDGFKKTTFTALKNTSGANEATKDTFKDAINANTAKINKGLKFKGDTNNGSNGEQQLYLGSTLTIKGAETTAQTSTQGAGAAKHQNITTTAKDGGILEIALNTNLKDITSIGKDENNVLTFKNSTSGGNSADLKVGGASLTFTKSDNGDKVKISGIADGESENDAVTVKQLTSSKLHYLSVKGPNGTSNGDNYNNDGAKAQNSIAIGSKASVKDDKSHDAIAIGYNSLVENAKWSMAIGANTQAKSIQSLALGYQAKVLEKSDASIAIGVSDTKIENAKWAVALGNKITINGSGNNVVAIGSNINVGSGNDDLIVIGNRGDSSPQITNAKNSVIIGKQAISQAESAVVIGKGANVETNATGAVAIGDGATVAETAGDSVAIGKNSRADEKMFAPDGIDANVGSQSLKINWKDAGASATDKDYKSVFSIGDAGNERVITNVAAGYVIDGSTDAVNGGQLYSVIHTFGNLASDVLGAEVNTDTDKEADGTPKYGFKKSTFVAVNYKDSTKQAKDTFKGAIDETITAINKGLKFAGNTGEKQLQLGDTLAIKGKEDSANSSHKNISTEAKDGGILEIALNSELKGIQSIANGDNAKIALDKDAKTIKFTSGDTPTEVSLKASTLSGITEINKATDKGALKLTENSATLESTKDNSKLELKDKTATLESAKDKSKLELAEDSATLSAGNGKGSIKVSNGTSNKIELSPENGSTVTFAKDTANGNTVKATGLSTIGKDENNALVFKNGTSGTSGTNTAELKVGGATLTFTPTNGTGNAKTVKISNVAVGKIESSSLEAITGGQLADLATHLGVDVDSSGKTAFTAPSFNAINGGTTQKTFKGAIDQLITAVNGGLTFKGNDTSPTSTTLQLGGTLTIDSSTVGSGANGTTEKDITVSLAPNDKDVKDAGTLTLKLNKATEVKEGDEKVVTSKAVATELKKYTTTADLDKGYLKVDGSNIGEDEEKKKQGRKTFGSNVGIAEIKLDGEKSSTELVQADAVIKYLKGKGEKSVKVSDNPETEAEGVGSIAIGDKAIAKNEGAIAIGYGANAKNRNALSIGRDSEVLGEHATAIGFQNNVLGNDSGAFGKDNKVSGEHAYVLGAYNEIGGEHTYVLGSSVTTTKDITNAVILGNKSTGVSGAVSVGGAGDGEQRRIVYVANPENQYDAVNKQYVDGLGLKFKGNDSQEIRKKLSQILEIVGKGLNKAQTAKFKGTNGNIAVKSSSGKDKKLEISLNEKLSNIKTIENKGS